MPTLLDIQTLVRNLTRAPSPAQLTDAAINEAVNTFLLYDFSYRIRPLDLRRTLTFYTSPYVDTYSTNTVDLTSPLYNFKNKYVNVMNPFYVAGFPAVLTQDRETFWAMYPQQQFVTTLPRLGDGVTTHFTGTLAYCPAIYQNTVTFTSQALVGANIVANTIKDVPNYLANGIMATTGQFVVPDQTAPFWGTINYVTGAYDITFPLAPMAQKPITVEYLSYVPGRPYNILFFNDTFYIRPVPDRAYPITMDVTIRPTELFAAGDIVEISQWWQYIAYGASIKILQRRLDQDTIALITPEFLEQEALCMRKTLVQNTSKRTTTIYNQPSNFRYGYGWPTDFNFFLILFTMLTKYAILPYVISIFIILGNICRIDCAEFVKWL